jgi:membrane protease YdiL (CAAX protease family)
MQQAPSITRSDRIAIGGALVLPTVITWVYFILLDGAPAASQQSAYAVGKVIQFGLPVVWVCLVQRNWQKLHWPKAWSLIAGIAFGLAVAGAMAVLYFAVLKPAGVMEGPATAARAKVASFGVVSPVVFLGIAAFYSAIHSLLEEYYWRWFVFGQLSRSGRLPTAILISSVGFAAHHVLVLQHYFGWLSPLTWVCTLGIVIGGAFWAWLYRASNSIVGPWISHSVIDAAIFGIGYQMLQT